MESENKQNKKTNPRQNANILSAVTFWWMLPIFYAGYKKEFELSDIFETLEDHRSCKMGDMLEKAWKKEKLWAAKSKRPPSFFRVLIRKFGPILGGYSIIIAIIELVVKMVQPIALGKLVMYYSTDMKDRDETEAYIYASILIITSLISEIVFHPYLMGILHTGLKMTVSCCSLMYRKSLRLSKTSLGETTVGQIVNLMSNDVNRLNAFCLWIHDLWIGPIACVLVTIIMYQEIGISSIFGTLYIIAYIPFQSWLGKRSAVYRLRTALRTDERLRFMNEIINGIQVIKMYTWEKPFAQLVALARRKEINQIRVASYIRGVNVSFILFTTRTAIFISILAYVLFGHTITASKVFVVAACYNILKSTMTDFFPYAIAQIAEAYISVKRMEKFLLKEENNSMLEHNSSEINGKKIENWEQNGIEKSNVLKDNQLSINNVKKSSNGSINLKNVTAKWNSELTENTLTNISLNIASGKLVTVIGPVGSGKTSLLHIILREFLPSEGVVEANGVVSYASQESWLFSGSVRQNILFGQTMDKVRYQKVVHCCALKPDFELLPHGDKTIVGERGVSLSGGQRARINLARAVYKQADIYLLDDPLSAVDTHVGKQLFDTCINGMLIEKTVILITHQLQYLKEVEQIVILNRGVKEVEGSYQQLKESGLDFAKLLEEDKEEEQSEGKQLTERRKSILSVPSTEEKQSDEPQQVEEHRSYGNVGGKVYKAYFQAAGNKLVLAIIVLFFCISQIFSSASDYFLSYWVNLEEDRNKNNATASEDDFWDFSRDTCLYIYSGLVLLTIVVTLARSFLFFQTCMRASRNLHDNMFTSITRATMQFFNTNTSGRILNRFSKDMGSIDELIPNTLLDVLQIGLSLLGIIALVAIVNPWLLIPTITTLIMFYFLRSVFLPTSRSLKRLEGITNSPVFGHLAASLQGLTTIRAFNAQDILQKEFDNHQDFHSTVLYVYLAASRTFALWLDFSCTVYLTIITIVFFYIGTENGGNVGLVLTQVMGMLGMIQWGIRQSSELENQMTAVERVVEYSNIEKERSLESEPNKKPPSTWPTDGRIEFRNLYLSYTPSDPPVLKNLNFQIESREKIGIVGRTGAGKSSLIAALFQLTNTDGSLIIDAVDTKTIGLHDLRSKVAIIPQEPVLFSGTMRKNLDPFDEYSDEVLWRALEEVELKQAVSDLPGGLNSKMSEGGTNFSVGQRQLVCLARAIVRNNKILVLDEATANVDMKTDALVQNTIRNKFAECTVLTIAHRLNTVMDSDKVLVMHSGHMVEFDHPYVLMMKSDGFLTRMVERTGPIMAQTLRNIAKENYKVKFPDQFVT